MCQYTHEDSSGNNFECTHATEGCECVCACVCVEGGGGEGESLTAWNARPNDTNLNVVCK